VVVALPGAASCLEQVEELNRAKAATEIAVNLNNFIISVVNDVLLCKFGFSVISTCKVNYLFLKMAFFPSFLRFISPF
jgi:hypothetical protein